MTVIHLISDTNRRGAQVFASELVSALNDLGIDGELAALTTGSGPAQLDVPVIPPGWQAQRRLLRGATLVVAHGSTTLDFSATRAPRRFIYRSIGDPRFWLDSSRRRIKTGLLLSAAAAVVPLYQEAATAFEQLAKVPRAKLTVIPNAVARRGPPVPEEPELTTAAHHVLYVGALSPEKQVDHAIEAAAELDDVGLIVVGDGPERVRLQSLAAERLPGRFLFTGALDDPTPYYRAADVLVITSATEGQPGCMLEAAQAGLPTCAYRVGGIPELIAHGVPGRLVSGRADLATALRSTIDAQARDTASTHASLPKTYGMAAVAPRWAELIEQHRARSSSPSSAPIVMESHPPERGP